MTVWEPTEPTECPYFDPLCPCNDGDACNWEDTGGGRQWRVSVHVQKLMGAEIRRLRNLIAPAVSPPSEPMPSG